MVGKRMVTYSKAFKEEALKLSNEVGVKAAAGQPGILYTHWRTGEAAGGI